MTPADADHPTQQEMEMTAAKAHTEVPRDHSHIPRASGRGDHRRQVAEIPIALLEGGEGGVPPGVRDRSDGE